MSWFVRFPVRPWLSLVLVMALATPAAAMPSVDFQIAPSSPGSVFYAGGTAALLGSDIQIVSIVGVGTPHNAGGNIPCPGCILSFSTGPFRGFEAGRWRFGPPGEITISRPTGSSFIGPQVTFEELLAAIMGTGVGLLAILALFPVGALDMAAAVEDNRSHGFPSIADFFGLPATPDVRYTAHLDFSFAHGGMQPPDPFTDMTIIGGKVSVTPVSEPATLFLLVVSALAAVLAWRYRSPRPWRHVRSDCIGS